MNYLLVTGKAITFSQGKQIKIRKLMSKRKCKTQFLLLATKYEPEAIVLYFKATSKFNVIKIQLKRS